MRLGPAAAVIALLFPAIASAASADSGRRVGVISIGTDATVAGDLQREVELRLGSGRNIVLKGANDLGSLARVAPLAPAPGPDAATAKEATDLLQKATDAYYEDRAAFALDRLGALNNLQEKAGNFPVADRVRLLLWRTAVFLALKDEAQAESEALGALTLSPDLKVDLNEFRPSVKEMVDRVRTRGLRQVTVVVSGLPPGATLKVDERPVGPRFLIPVGKHRLSGSAIGRREVIRTFDATADVAVPMTLPLSLDPSLDGALSGMVWRGQPSPSDVQTLSSIAERAGLDWVVVVANHAEPANEMRAVLLSLARGGSNSASPLIPASPTATASLVAWIDSRVQAEIGGSAPAATPSPTSTVVAAATPAPRPARTPAPVVRPPVSRGRSPAIEVAARAGVLWLDRVRTVKGGPQYQVGFAGAGPRLSVDLARGAIFGEVEAAFLSYGISTLDVTLPSGTKRTVGGGSSLVVRAGGGWRHAFGSGDWEGSPSIRAGLGVAHESHSAEDVKNDSNAPLFLLTSYTRDAIELRADARYPFPEISIRPAVLAGLSVGPAIGYSESPSGASGSSPAAGPEIAWRVGVDLQPAARFGVSAEYLGAMRSTKFKGPAKVTSDPPMSDATVSESFQGFVLAARYRF